MEMYEQEKAEAIRRLEAAGRSAEDFTFAAEMLPPDPDGGGMFTVQYEIRIRDETTGKGLLAIGGIGSDWVGYFEDALREGFFD